MARGFKGPGFRRIGDEEFMIKEKVHGENAEPV
jgi:hypothetical protein